MPFDESTASSQARLDIEMFLNTIKRLLFWFLVVFVVSAFLMRIVLAFQHRSAAEIPDGFNVVFCHAKLRCPACLKMESLVRRTLDTVEEPIRSQIRLVSLEYDDPANRVWVERFHVGTATVILLKQENGKSVRWRNMTTEVWNNLNDDDAFVAMLHNAIQEQLQDQPNFENGERTADAWTDSWADSWAEWNWMLFGVIFLLGIQTALSPCPLTTTIAAMAYIGRRTERSRDVLLAGLLYATGQMSAYFLLAFFVLGIPIFAGDQLTRFFTMTLHSLLGPILVFVGMALTGLMQLPLSGIAVNGETMRKTVDRLGWSGSLLLGAVFALAFCPTTAATFLAMLTLAGTAKSLFLFPLLFGFSAALPVLVFAGILAFQRQYLSGTFQALSGFEQQLRRLVGIVFIALGVFWTLR